MGRRSRANDRKLAALMRQRHRLDVEIFRTRLRSSVPRDLHDEDVNWFYRVPDVASVKLRGQGGAPHR